MVSFTLKQVTHVQVDAADLQSWPLSRHIPSLCLGTYGTKKAGWNTGGKRGTVGPYGYICVGFQMLFIKILLIFITV